MIAVRCEGVSVPWLRGVGAPARLILMLAGGLLAGCAASSRLMAVNVAVVDLRAQPRTSVTPGVHDPLQETQLVYGERVRVRAVKDGWAQVEAVEQAEYTHARRWQGYPGWLPAAALIAPDPLASPNIVVTVKWAESWQDAYGRAPSPHRFPLGTRLRAVDMGGQLWRVELLDGSTVWMPRGAGAALRELLSRPLMEQRRGIVRTAELFIGEAYWWGGRSPQPEPAAPGRAGGVDCSGLTHLAYRAAGFEIPRDAHEQRLRATRVNALQPADLVFLSERDNPARIVHVMLYAGEGQLIEGPGTGQRVRRISVAERLGRPLDSLASGSAVDGQTVSFGAYLP
jgi:cell wall-associated NlpC family hydrolase